MNWTNEMNYNCNTIFTAPAMNVPHWAEAEGMRISTPLCELVNLGEKASKNRQILSVPTVHVFFSVRAGLANALTKLADFVSPDTYATRA